MNSFRDKHEPYSYKNDENKEQKQSKKHWKERAKEFFGRSKKKLQ